MQASGIRVERFAFPVFAALGILVAMPTPPAWAQAPDDVAGQEPAADILGVFPPMEGEASADGLLTGKLAWDAPVDLRGEALFTAILGRDFTRADLAAVRLHLAWESGAKWLPDNAGFSFAVPSQCNFKLEVADATIAEWKAPCSAETLALKLPPKVAPPAGQASVTVHILAFKPSKGVDKKLPVKKARLRQLYATATSLQGQARPSRLFQPHQGAARLFGGDRYSWSRGEWVKVKGQQCDVPCEFECSCRYKVQGSKGAGLVPTGDLIKADALLFSPSGEWLVASTLLDDVESGAPILRAHASIVLDHEGNIVRLPTWLDGDSEGGCGDDKDCLAICPANTPHGDFWPMIRMNREFRFREDGTALVLTATDTVQNCGKEGVTKSRVAEYRIEHRGNGLELAPAN